MQPLMNRLRVLSSQEYYDLPVIMPSREKWILPAGAFAKKVNRRKKLIT